MLHFKDRLPEETIQILKDFFKSKNLQLNELQTIQSEGNTYSCQYELVFKNITILEANGKGINPSYALASCLAEMYERFCANQEHLCGNILSYLKYQELNFKKYNYYNDQTEQLVTNLKEDLFFQKTLINLFTEDTDIIIKELFNNKLYKVRYDTYDKTDSIYYTPFYIQLGEGTNGLAAGNTLEEALVQGISEIFERYGIELFFKWPKFKYYYLNHNILPDYLQVIIQAIESKNQKVYLFDLSYNFQIPVILTIIYNLTDHNYSLNFGASPIIDIAIERGLTEIYQGRKKLSHNKMLVSSNQTNWVETTYALNFSHDILNIYPILENMILFSKEKEYNKKVFLSTAENNKELLLHLITLGKNLNINFYYKNLSYIKDFYAVRIVTNQKLNLYLITKYEDKFSEIPNKNKLLQLYIDYMKQIINHSLDFTYLENLKNEKQFNANFFLFFLSLTFCDIFNPMKIQLRDISKNYQKLQKLLYNENTTLQPYQLINYYFIDNTYTKEEIQQILKEFGYEKKEIKYYTNKTIIKELLKELWNIYNSDEYKEFLELFIK